MKTYRNPQTGHKVKVDENDAAAIASLEAQGYGVWGVNEIKQKIQDNAKAVESAKAQLTAARREMADRYPAAEAENLMPKPLNPAARVTTQADDERHASMRGMEDELASVTVETKQPSGATDVTTVPAPSAPAVPKKN